jgi:hypothetical protein
MKRTNRTNGRRPRRLKKKTTEPIRIEIGLKPRKPSEIEIQGKKALLSLLAEAERDPGKVIDGIGKLAHLATETKRFIEENPGKAKKVMGHAAMSFLAGLARKRLASEK